jgi:hypothetical protein
MIQVYYNVHIKTSVQQAVARPDPGVWFLYATLFVEQRCSQGEFVSPASPWSVTSVTPTPLRLKLKGPLPTGQSQVRSLPPHAEN